MADVLDAVSGVCTVRWWEAGELLLGVTGAIQGETYGLLLSMKRDRET